jgi:NhaP-type Na+/H+ or K+/H+ antiporter
MNLRQRLQQRDSWLHLDFNVSVAAVVVVTVIAYVIFKFKG